MDRRFVRIGLGALAIVLAFALAACNGGGGGGYQAPGTTPSTGGATGGTAPTPGAVKITNFTFDPASVEVTAGSAVTWTNDDSTAHTVVADDGTFQSGDVATGGTYSFTFAKPGTVKYHCSIHPSMVGQVVVK